MKDDQHRLFDPKLIEQCKFASPEDTAEAKAKGTKHEQVMWFDASHWIVVTAYYHMGRIFITSIVETKHETAEQASRFKGDIPCEGLASQA